MSLRDATGHLQCPKIMAPSVKQMVPIAITIDALFSLMKGVGLMWNNASLIGEFPRRRRPVQARPHLSANRLRKADPIQMTVIVTAGHGALAGKPSRGIRLK
jgi:hypothetical protein